MISHVPLRATAAALLALATLRAAAQEPTRIVAATVYPDSARVQRELKVPGGERHVVIACLPGGVDLSTLQVEGDPELRVGEIRSTPLPNSRARECDPSPIEARQQSLDQRRAQLEAQRDSDELALAFLKTWGSNPHADGGAATTPADPGRKAPPPSRPGALAGDLRQAALDLLVDQARIKRELADLERDGDKLADEVPPSHGKGNWRTVRFDVWTPAAAALRVSYNVNNTYWRPTYRATMDSTRGTLRIDRQAEIVQASGEDWAGVHVKLSTGRVNRPTHAWVPQPWTLDLQQPMLASDVASATTPVFAAAPAPAPLMQRLEITGGRVDKTRPVPPPWGTSAVSTDYASEFDVEQSVTLASDGETHTLQLTSQTLPATLKRRTTPREDRAVYLLAEATRPAGVWPDGPLQAWIDGALVSRSPWQPAQGDKLQVALGQDDQMHVDVESPGAFTQSRGVFGGSTERTSAAVYAIVNQHRDAVTVEMLDASPVSRNEAIQVTHTYAPLPSATDWNKIPGVAEWTLAIPAQQTARVSIAHAVTAPRDARVTNLP
jgi:uncharacterized protein (TIGR02231 family)